jgi:hypothetical protein
MPCFGDSNTVSSLKRLYSHPTCQRRNNVRTKLSTDNLNSVDRLEINGPPRRNIPSANSLYDAASTNGQGAVSISYSCC